jgi:hypothetical protein
MAIRAKKAESPPLPVPLKQELIPISRLVFDTENPRIRYLLGGSKPTQLNVEETLMGGGMDAGDLVPSFMQNGYLPYEPLIVRPARGDKHVVLEGNRRLAALRSMSRSDDPDVKKAFVEKRLDTVPCLIFEGTETDELAYLGLRHLSKTKDWSPSAKAEFVERILRYGLKLADAARLTSTTTSALRGLLLTSRLFERARRLGIELPAYSAEGDVMFWHLGDAVRRTNTKNYLKITENEDPLEQPDLDEGHFENLITWVYGNPKTKQARLVNSIRDIPDLDRCLVHPKSMSALENGQSIEEALEEAQAAGCTVISHLDRAKKSVQRATSSVSDIDKDGLKGVEEARDALAKAIETFDSAFEPRKGKQ